MATAKKQATEKQPSLLGKKLSRRLIITLASVTALLLLLLNIAVWTNNYLFSTSTFSQTAMPALTNDSSTKAIAAELSDRLLQDRPVLKRVLDDRVTNLLAALLQTDLSERAFQRAVTRLQIMITSNNPSDVVIDLSGIKNVIVQVLAIGRQISGQSGEEAQITGEQIPDTIVLLRADALPNVYIISVGTLWLALITALAALGILGYLLYELFRQRFRQLQEILWSLAATLFIGGLLGLALVSLSATTALGSFASPNVRIVVQNLLDAFTSTLSTQLQLGMLLPAALLALAALCIMLWPSAKIFIDQQRSQRKA